MGFSILDPHPNNECIDLDSQEAWFSFIFCGSRIDTLRLHAYDYYTGDEIIAQNTVYESVPVLDPKLSIWNGVGNGVRVNLKDFVKDASLFDADGEYTWRAELIQNIDVANGYYPDNVVFEGTLAGDPNFYATIDNIEGFDYSHFLPLTPAYKNRIRPPYYIDFLDSKFGNTVYDVPVTFDKIETKRDGTQDTVIQLDTYTTTNELTNTKAIPRPAVGTQIYIHKNKNYSPFVAANTQNKDAVFIDPKIPHLNVNDTDNTVYDGCYIKVKNDYYKIQSYDSERGIIICKNGEKLKDYPAGTHYTIYTSRFWTPYYYFRVHTMPRLIVDAEFHEHRRLKPEETENSVNCLDNTFNGILFKGYLVGDPHSAVKYHYWEIISASTGKTVFKTEKVYSEDMACEVFVPFGETYIGRLTVVTQDGITVRNEVEYALPASPAENNARFRLRALQNRFGGIELAWDYSYFYDYSSFWKVTDFEVFRIDKRLRNYGGKDWLKYLGKVDCMPFGITGVKPAHSGGNWFLIDRDCDFTLKTPIGSKVNMYLVGGGCDGGDWTAAPTDKNKSFAVGQSGGEGGYFLKRSLTSSSGMLECHAKIAPKNQVAGTSLKVNGTTYKCNDVGSEKRGKVSNGSMTQVGDKVEYSDGANGTNGFETPYGLVGSSGGGGVACGNNRTDGKIKITGVTPKINKGTWMLLDRESLGGGSGEFDLELPEGANVKMWLVGGGQDGEVWFKSPQPGWDKSRVQCYSGGAGGYVLEKEISVSGQTHCTVNIADRNDDKGTNITIGGVTYNCNDSGAVKRKAVSNANAVKNSDGSTIYNDADRGENGVKIDVLGKYVGSSGGGGGVDNIYKNMLGGNGGDGAGNGGSADAHTANPGTDAQNYGCGGGTGSAKELDYKGNVIISKAGKGMPGCIILELVDTKTPCPDPGNGGIGAGDGAFAGDDGENAANYGCGGGGAGYLAVDSDGNVIKGAVGSGKQGCIILEIDTSTLGESGIGEQVYCVDWTAASDKEYRYIVTGCNYESAYLETRHTPEEMIECTASVDITPHFEDFYLYFLNDADILVKSNPNYENYETSLVEPMGRYVVARNNPYQTVRRNMHTLALDRDTKAFYRRHSWRIEGDVTIDSVTHNITRNISPLYAKMPSSTQTPTDYDSFTMSFLFGYMDCEREDGSDFEFNDQYIFELWKQCVYEKQTVMIKDPKGNIWTGVLTGHEYNVKYDTRGMPYIITVNFTQTRTEHNSLVMIVDDHNKYLKTAKQNHLK